MTPFQMYGRNYANYTPENFQIKLMQSEPIRQCSNQLNLMDEADSVNTQVQILTGYFLLALTLMLHSK